MRVGVAWCFAQVDRAVLAAKAPTEPRRRWAHPTMRTSEMQWSGLGMDYWWWWHEGIGHEAWGLANQMVCHSDQSRRPVTRSPCKGTWCKAGTTGLRTAFWWHCAPAHQHCLNKIWSSKSPSPSLNNGIWAHSACTQSHSCSTSAMDNSLYKCIIYTVLNCCSMMSVMSVQSQSQYLKHKLALTAAILAATLKCVSISNWTSSLICPSISLHRFTAQVRKPT